MPKNPKNKKPSKLHLRREAKEKRSRRMIRFNKQNLMLGLFIMVVLPLFYLMSQRPSNLESPKPDQKPEEAKIILGAKNEVVVPNTQSEIIHTVTQTFTEKVTIAKPEPTNSVVQTVSNKANACFVILVRNEDLYNWLESMQQLEDRFNKKFNYPYVFLNDKPFTDSFKAKIRSYTSAVVEFATIPKEHWSVPEFVQQSKFEASMKQMHEDKVMYGDRVSYHHMCRFESGFFFRQKVLEKYDYYWRVEPDVHFPCDIKEDPFLYMQENNKDYGFTISIKEYENTIPTLWKEVNKFLDMDGNRAKLPQQNSWKFVSDSDKLEKYNLCHFWSNFEIANLKIWRDPMYIKFFDYLDRTGGFFYERWGDAPVHSIYVALFLEKSKLHFFDNIGYSHNPFTHCPKDVDTSLKCSCDPKKNFDLEDYSCTKKWFDINGISY